MYRDDIDQIKKLYFKNEIYDKTLGNKTNPETVDPELLCFYGHNCKRKNSAHIKEFLHINIPEHLASEKERYLKNFEALTTDMSQKVDAAYTLASSNPTPAEFTASSELDKAIAAASAVKPNEKELFTLDKGSIRDLDFDILKLIDFRNNTLQQL